MAVAAAPLFLRREFAPPQGACPGIFVYFIPSAFAIA